jgi:hypothetical protein
MDLAPYWYNWDNNRFWKKKAIIINIDKRINPAITPDNHQEVMNILKDKINDQKTIYPDNR